MIYTGEYLKEISFPIGGIGTGSIGLAGNGRFIDWEIFNKPAKGSILWRSHIAVKAKYPDGRTIVKILNGDETRNLSGQYSKTIFGGFGYGQPTGSMCGLDHFRECEFDGEFPIATITFRDDEFPGVVRLTAFNPFIPLDSENSSIPAAFFKVAFENTSNEEIDYSAILTIRNPFKEAVNKKVVLDGHSGITMSTLMDKSDVKYGDLTMVSDAEDVWCQEYWYRGKWGNGLEVYVDELLNRERLQERTYDTPGNDECSSMGTTKRVAASSTDEIRFVLSWNIPNNYNYWDENNLNKQWKNYYATVYPTSAESALYSIKNFDSLYERTLAFKNTLYDSSIDKIIIEAISATMSVLKTATVLRLQDGSFYGWEGLNEEKGSCEGTCQHVYNYAYALCFLFPDLERSLRNNEYKYCVEEDGKLLFRMTLPPGEVLYDFRACLDGSMGLVIKTYREWKISGDTQWLRQSWQPVKSVLEYAWSDQNPDRWDRDKDGVLEGRQHHTLDMELFGPSSWLESMYMCALKAAAEMAEALGEHVFAKECLDLFDKAYGWTKENLFNGEYFIQKIDLNDKSIPDSFNSSEDYWYEERGEIKYQIGEGSIIDQMLGQWHANILGLGDLFDREQMKTALKNVYKYNFKPSMRKVMNTWRLFALNDEAGTIMCEYPENVRKPVLPIPYNKEVMTGFEYAIAGLMISEGMEEEGHQIIKAIRERYDGRKRNPWNEIECGSNYARAMASYALLPIYSGFKFDLPNKMIGFDPIHKNNFKSFFSVGTAWGELSWSESMISLKIKEGQLELHKFAVNADVKKVLADGKEISFSYENGQISFAAVIIYDALEVVK